MTPIDSCSALTSHHSNTTHHPVVDCLFIANSTLHCVSFPIYIFIYIYIPHYLCHIWLKEKRQLTSYCWPFSSLHLLHPGQEHGKESRTTPVRVLLKLVFSISGNAGCFSGMSSMTCCLSCSNVPTKSEVMNPLCVSSEITKPR